MGHFLWNQLGLYHGIRTFVGVLCEHLLAGFQQYEVFPAQKRVQVKPGGRQCPECMHRQNQLKAKHFLNFFGNFVWRRVKMQRVHAANASRQDGQRSDWGETAVKAVTAGIDDWFQWTACWVPNLHHGDSILREADAESGVFVFGVDDRNDGDGFWEEVAFSLLSFWTEEARLPAVVSKGNFWQEKWLSWWKESSNRFWESVCEIDFDVNLSLHNWHSVDWESSTENQLHSKGSGRLLKWGLFQV
jgi:hypothetical protein